MISTHQSFFVKTKLLVEYPFDEQFKMSADYDFLLNMFKKNKKFYYIPLPVVYFQTGGASQEKPFYTMKEVETVQKKNGVYLNDDRTMEKLRKYIIGMEKIFMQKIPDCLRYCKYEKTEGFFRG